METKQKTPKLRPAFSNYTFDINLKIRNDDSGRIIYEIARKDIGFPELKVLIDNLLDITGTLDIEAR